MSAMLHVVVDFMICLNESVCQEESFESFIRSFVHSFSRVSGSG